MRRQIEQAFFLVTLVAAVFGCSSQQQAVAPRKMARPDSTRTELTDAATVDSGVTPSAADAGLQLLAAGDLALPDSCAFGCSDIQSPLDRATVQAKQAPPPLSGGTLLSTRDAKWLVAADPDRDRIYFVDVEQGKLAHVRELSPGAQPGRVIEDDAGRIHVALRGRAALLTLTRAPDSPLTERPVCAEPRGLAYDAASTAVHVACADGKLVTIGAEPSAAVTRSLQLGRDLRDVIVRGDELLVTRFRSAELLRVGVQGALLQTWQPPSFPSREQFPYGGGSTVDLGVQAPTVAWRAIEIPGKGSALLHQRSREGEVKVSRDGYGSLNCGGILQSALTIGLERSHSVSADLGNAALAVDLAANPSATLLAVASPGNWGSNPQLAVFSLTGTSPLNLDAPSPPLLSRVTATGVTRWTSDQGRPIQVCVTPRTQFPAPDGQVTSVAFVSDHKLAVLEREPAAISFIDISTGLAGERIDLGQDSRYDTGHALFHMRTPAGLACASCHAEAGDDAHVWQFQGIGPRRTQNLRGGILGTEPFHWDGDMSNFDALVRDVLVSRMSVAKPLSTDNVAALARWIDVQPRLSAEPGAPEPAQRGKALFDSAGCSSCHAGPLFANNQSVDVGTGGAFQVPALRGVSQRLPLMHNGCAHTLRERFDAACGGDDHGEVAQLSAAEIDDLVAYLETL